MSEINVKIEPLTTLAMDNECRRSGAMRINGMAGALAAQGEASL